MRMLFAMSVAGSIPLLIYYLVFGTGKKPFAAKQKMCLLRLSMLFFLLPFQDWKYALPNDSFFSFLFLKKPRGKIYYLKLPGYITVYNLEGETYELVAIWKLVFLALWIAGIVTFCIVYVYRYRKMKKTLWNDSEKIGKSGNISYLKNGKVKSPFTIGIFQRWIIFPEEVLDQQEKRMVDLHEKTHVRNRDTLGKCVCVVILLLHWYNPAAWLLLHEYCKTAEELCDEYVVNSLHGKEEAGEYAKLLVKFTETKKQEIVIGKNYLTGGEKQLKRRIERIFHGTKKKKCFPVVVLVTIFLCSATAIGYQKPGGLESSDQFAGVSDGDFYWMDNEGKIIEEENYDFSMGNFVFTENNGKEMTFTKEIQNSRVSCAHTYVTGEYKKHIRNSTGGCKIIIYRARRCSKCGSIQIIKRLNTLDYEKCNH